MFGGVAHYSAELVPIVVVSAILGAEWLSKVVARRLRIPFGIAVTICSVYVLVASLLNHRVNGFSPLAEHFSYSPITAHDKIVNTMLAMIPANASVSAEDNLNAHLSDRDNIYLYPDLDANRVQYIALDATQPTGSVIRPCDLTVQVSGDNDACDIAAGPVPVTGKADRPEVDNRALLRNGSWTIVFAQDGVLLLQRHKRGEPLVTTLPPAFFTFMSPPASSIPSGAPIARFGGYLELESYSISRSELVNLRNPDVVVTTRWRVLKALPARSRLLHYLSDSTGALQVFSDDQQATDWSVLGRWQVGNVYRVDSYQLTVTTNTSGPIDIDLGLTVADSSDLNVSFNENVSVLNPHDGVRAVGGGKVLMLQTIHASM
jgi:hypothetical protein